MSDIAENVLRAEAAAILAVADRHDPATFHAAADVIMSATGVVFTAGVGKSYIIAHKVAETMTSTGTRAMVVHPADSMHGQLGLISHGDVVIAFSNSGETEELTTLLPYWRSRNVRLIVVTGNLSSTLAKAAEIVLDAGVEKEAGALGLAPTSSTTVALAVGDALAIELLTRRGLTADDFARNHPSGRLGRRLTLAVSDLMRSIPNAQFITSDTPLLNVIASITAGESGAALVMADGHLIGIVTDGDVRRALSTVGIGPWQDLPAAQMMTSPPLTVPASMGAFEALQIMENPNRRITVLPVVADDGSGTLVGVLRLSDVVAAGL